ncbi:MAG TPA: PaaI family thioesterase, partial [Myxococcales bacterium]|nr:PaaI family thioesterase [Myxococcales bacterium]
MADPTRTRTITWHDPIASAAAGRELSGLAYLQAMVRGELPRPPIGILMDFNVAEVEKGRVVFEVEPAEFHYNPIGMVHGGLAATLCDSALGFAVHSTLPVGTGYTTVDLNL